MEKCPLMKNMCLSPYFREFIAERSPMHVKGSVKNSHGDCQFTVHWRFQIGEKTFECEKMGRPIFVPHTLSNMSKFTLMRNLTHVENLEKCVHAEWGRWLSTECPSHSVALRFLHSTVDRLPKILKLIFTLALKTDLDIPNSFPEFECFLKAYERHI